MKKIPLILILILFLFNGYAQEHPRLFFDKKELATLRARQYTPVGKEMLDCLLEQLEEINTTGVDGATYDQALGSALNGFLYLITEDEKYAIASKKNIETLFTLEKWADTGLKGLTSYWMGTYVAFAYDFCYNSPNWDDDYKKSISSKIVQMADMIADNGGTEQNRNAASNWQGIRGASAAICYYATDEAYDDNKLTASCKKTYDYVKENYGGEYMSRGWNIEGLGYLFYPTGNFIGPFGIMMDRLDPARGLRKNASFVNSFWTIYAAISTALDLKGFGGLHPDFGDDNPHITGEGAFGQAFYYLPGDMKKAAKHCYDMAVGSGRKTNKHDKYRFGTVWAYMFYPDQLENVDPMTVHAWKELFIEHTTDGCGYFTYRNAYKDGNDQISQMYIKFRGNKGHNGPDALTYRIIGQGAAWAVGGGRYGIKAPGISNNDVYWHLMNTIYPQEPLVNSIIDPTTGKAGVNGQSGRIVGNPLLRDNGSGHVVSEIDKNNVWTQQQKRWFVADYDKNKTGAEAAYIIADETLDGKFWQMVTTEDNTIQFYSNYFIITAANGATMRGTVLLNGGDYNFKQKLSVRGSDFGDSKNSRVINFQSNNGKFIVALTIAEPGKNHPTVKLTGDDVVGAKIKIGVREYTLTTDNVLYDGVNESTTPRPIWSLDNNVGTAPFTVKFDASKSMTFDTKPLRFLYDFGDGGTSSEVSPQYTYKVPGTYLAGVDVKNSAGKIRSLYSYVFVKNNPNVNVKIVKPTYDICEANSPITIEAEASTSITSASIEKVEFLIDGEVIGSDITAPFTYTWKAPSSGVYNISARAYADNGQAISESPVFYLSVNGNTTAVPIFESNNFSILNRVDNLVFSNNSEKPVYFELIDISGKVVYASQLSVGESSIDKTSFSKGIYIVRINKDINITQKIII